MLLYTAHQVRHLSHSFYLSVLVFQLPRERQFVLNPGEMRPVELYRQ